MRSDNILYNPDLDVLRGAAATMVFVWHFVHFDDLIPMTAYWPGLALIEEGHVGVSLFMVLSGYLFFKITWGKAVDWWHFARNRIVRIAPLLIVTQLLWVVLGLFTSATYAPANLLAGLVFPSWTGGAWSIAVEMHFYLLLPVLLLVMQRRPSRLLPLYLIAAAIPIAFALPPDIAGYTIIGLLSHFLIGGLLALYLPKIPAWAGAGVFLLFVAYLEMFNLGGGHAAFIENEHSWLAPSFPRWIIEGVGFAGLMAWVLNSDWRIKDSALWRGAAWLGKVSYSVYLLHFFLLIGWFKALAWLGVGDTVRLLSILPCFAVLLLVSAISYRLIEAPFLKRRVRYVGAAPPAQLAIDHAAPQGSAEI